MQDMNEQLNKESYILIEVSSNVHPSTLDWCAMKDCFAENHLWLANNKKETTSLPRLNIWFTLQKIYKRIIWNESFARMPGFWLLSIRFSILIQVMLGKKFEKEKILRIKLSTTNFFAGNKLSWCLEVRKINVVQQEDDWSVSLGVVITNGNTKSLWTAATSRRSDMEEALSLTHEVLKKNTCTKNTWPNLCPCEK